MLQPNTRIADFAVQRFVGRGPMSEVYLVRHVIRTTQVAAAKIFTDPRCVRRILADADAMARSALLQHSNIVAVIQAAPMATPPFLVSDFCSGGNLRAIIAAHPMDPADAAAVLRQILAALKYAHGMGMPHGNLKLENVLMDDRAVPSRFTDEGSVKISEFGLGRAQIGAILEAGDTIDPSALNEVAPEIRQGQIPDAAADLFSCGVILFELLTGRLPKPGELPSHFNRLTPPHLDLLYQQSTAPRDRRIRSADELLAGLSDAPKPASPLSVPAPVETSDPAPAIPSRSPAGAASFATTPLKLDASDAAPIELELAPAEDEMPLAMAGVDDEPIALAPISNNKAENAIKREESNAPADRASLPQSPAGAAADDANLLADLSINRSPQSPRGAAARPARTVIVDELQRRPLRTSDALRGAFGGYVESAPLASSEVANIRIRLGQWAATEGGDDNFAANIEIVRAVTTPIHRITLRTSAARGGMTHAEPVDVASLLPSADSTIDCAGQLTAEDYRPIVHLATEAFWPESFQTLELPRLTAAVAELLSDTDQDLHDGIIVRQELLISRAMVIDVQLIYGGSKFNLALAGNALKVVGAIKPFRRGNPQVLRRVAMAMDTPQMPESLSDLRQCLDPDGTPERAEFLLGSLRRRLAQAYLQEARDLAGTGWLESLDLVSRAESLSPTESGIAAHRHLVRKREATLYLSSGMVIGAIFGALGGTARPPYLPFIVAGAAAMLSGLIAWAILRLRFRRTLAAFCHALLLPTAIACTIAPAPPKFRDVKIDIICGVCLAIVITADIVLFKKFGRYILTSHHSDPLGGDPDAVVSNIQAYLGQDWEWLAPRYMNLGPMSNFVRARESTADGPG